MTSFGAWRTKGPRFSVVDPDGAVLLMREWKALQTNMQYQTMDAMDAVVSKYRTIDLRTEKIVVVVHWIGMDTNSQANVNVNARVYYTVSLSCYQGFVIELVMRFFLILGNIASASSSVTCRTMYWVVMGDRLLPYHFCECRDE